MEMSLVDIEICYDRALGWFDAREREKAKARR
jgi:hypothetical protein